MHYGLDDPTQWPQPWVGTYCHLGAIPRKPDNPNDPLSIMWLEPTDDDFEVVLLMDWVSSQHQRLSFQKMMRSLESRIKDYKQASPKQNKFFLILVKAMQDTLTHLDSLKTTFTEMRIGVAEDTILKFAAASTISKSTNHVWIMKGLRQNLSTIV